MAKRLLSLGLLTLLLFHALGTVFISFGTWWQEEHDLSEHLTVYRSVDSLIEFQIPITGPATSEGIWETHEEGFTYRGHYYDIVSIEIKGNHSFITCLENKESSFWQRDLLSFIKETFHSESKSSEKASSWLKLLLKEYYPTPKNALCFFLYHWLNRMPISDRDCLFSSRSLPVDSPPPRLV